MALIDVNMVSGFEPIIDELEMKSQMSTIDGVLSFYFDEVKINFKFSFESSDN